MRRPLSRPSSTGIGYGRRHAWGRFRSAGPVRRSRCWKQGVVSDELPTVLPRRHADVEVAEFDTEYVVFDPRCNEVHLITGLAAVVFDACDGVTPTAQLVEEIEELLQIPGDAVAREVVSALDQLRRIGILRGTAPTDRPP